MIAKLKEPLSFDLYEIEKKMEKLWKETEALRKKRGFDERHLVENFGGMTIYSPFIGHIVNLDRRLGGLPEVDPELFYSEEL